MLAKRLIEDLNFRSSGDPKIWLIEHPSMRFTRRLHSLIRGPRTGWFKYASASRREEIPNAFAMWLDPKP